MDDLAAEQAQLITEVTARADAQRRSWAFSLQMIASNVLFALTTLAPKAERVFGTLEPWLALVIITPAMVMVVANLWLYRRLGSGSRLFRASDTLESTFMYCIALSFIELSGLRWSLLWSLCVYTAIFWALTNPFSTPRFVGLILGTHAVHVVVMIVRGHGADIGAPISTGLAALLTFVMVARSRRASILAEAEGNLLRRSLTARAVETERARLGTTILAGVGQRLEALAGQARALEATQATSGLAVQAQAALRELAAIVSAARPDALPRSVDGLVALLQRKLTPLCVGRALTVGAAAGPAHDVPPGAALAVLRIGQELVRNAVVHGGAGRIDVELRRDAAGLALAVRDDGKGLHDQALAAATGGLRNARRWAEEHGGTLTREAGDTTALVVHLPLDEPMPAVAGEKVATAASAS
ncbi:MAG: hypothetical protein K1X89_08470 [Myxococcaceae bacterium]|nr:hypothetical protein [Myxococcaceae bacterium]